MVYPSPEPGMGYPPPGPGWGTPAWTLTYSPSRPGMGYLPIQTWLGGTPGTPHHPDLAGGYPGYPPPSTPGQGYPHHPDLAWVPPTIQTSPGYPPSRPGWGTPTIQTRLGYPPPSGPGWGTPLSRCGLTKKLKTVPSPILWIWAVTRKPSCLNARGIPPAT